MSEWISVKDRLPVGVDVECLVYFGGDEGHIASDEIDIAMYDKLAFGGFTMIYSGHPASGDPKKITHWMPLPEPPKESQ